MKETNELMHRISAARLAMEGELSDKRAAFESRLSRLEKELHEKEKFDYLCADLRNLCEARDEAERFCQRFLRLTEGGAPYRAGDILAKARPQSAESGEALSCFAQAIKKTAEAIRALDRAPTAAADEAPFFAFCEGLCTLRAFAKDGRALLVRDGVESARRKAACAPIENAIAALKDEYEKSIRTESLACYPTICEAKDAAQRAAEEAESARLGARTPKARFDYRFLIAFEHVQIDPQDARFIREVLSADPERMTEIPVFYCPEKDGRAILVRAHEDFFSTEEYGTLLWNLYYAAASKMPPHAVHLTGAECGNTSRLGLITEQYVKSLNGGEKDIPCEIAAFDTGELTKYLLTETKIQRSRRFANFYEHNRKNKHAPEALLLSFINEYPSGFENYRESGSTHLLHYLSGIGPRLGVIPIVFQNEDSTSFHPERAPHLEGDGFLTLDLTDPARALLDGREVSLDIRTPYTDDEMLYSDLYDHFAEKEEIFPLADVLEAADEEPRESFLPRMQLHAPIGLINGAPYYYTFQAGGNEHTLILGGSQAGKSSVLHTLILSLAHCYSPEEVQFYLADFKAGDVSPEFSHYQRIEGEENLYVPHVKYLQVHTDTADALDMLENISALYKQRLDFFRAHGGNDYLSYHRNNLEKIQSGALPRVPMTFFIIDEYHRMIEDAEKRADLFYDRLKSELTRIISTVRSGGIALVLVDQEMKGTTNQIFGSGTNIPNRLAVGETTREHIQRFFYASDKGIDAALDADHAFLNGGVKGRIMIGNTRAHARFRIAFSGNATSDEARRTAAAIRKKYAHIRTNQILGGSMTAFPARDGLDGIREAHVHKLCTGAQDVYRMALSLGVQSTGGIPCTLDFVTEAGVLPGCFAIANEIACAAIERNVMLAFLHRTADHYRYGAPRIDYCASIRAYSKSLEAYFQAIPDLDRHIRVRSEFESMAKCVMVYKQMLDRRSQEYRNTQSVSFAPQLLVIDDISWITAGQGLPKIPQEQAPHPTAAPAMPLSEEDLELLAAIKGEDGDDFPADDILALMQEMQGEQDAPAAEDDYDAYFTHRDLTEAIYKLYTEGSKYGIFLLLTASDEKIAAEFTDAFAYRTMHIESNRIYANGGAQGYCYMESSQSPVPKKVRLYHYEADGADPFFAELKKLL